MVTEWPHKIRWRLECLKQVAWTLFWLHSRHKYRVKEFSDGFDLAAFTHVACMREACDCYLCKDGHTLGTVD